ncbi:MAG: putative DNA-binding domain-containing protein [Vampirovibrionales bacterium]|nr:putative DNA-binding domain-containing protein [Vampirovibrionales bacterium]
MSLQAFQTLFYKLATTSEETATILAEDLALSGLFLALPNHQLQQYRWMVYANHAETLETIYPLTYTLLEDTWQPLVEHYLAAYPPKHYQLYETATDFPQFIAEQASCTKQYPFVVSLVAYELLEASILRMPSNDLPKNSTREVITSFNLGQLSPILQEASASFVCEYPLNTIVEILKQDSLNIDKLQSIEPQPLHLWVYRDSEFQCRFLKVTPFILACLENFRKAPDLSHEGHLYTVTQGFNLEIKNDLKKNYCELIQNFLSFGVLLGSR